MFESCVLGYAYINLFIDQSTRTPATLETTTPILMTGNYQLPIYYTPIPPTLPMHVSYLNELEHLPIASILVRITKAV